MDADTFYEHFKESLRHLGPGWRDKDKINIYVEYNRFVMQYEDRAISINLSDQKEKYYPEKKSESREQRDVPERMPVFSLSEKAYKVLEKFTGKKNQKTKKEFGR